MSALSSLIEYSRLIAEIPDTYPSVQLSTLSLWPIDSGRVVLKGEIRFAGGVRLHVLEVLNLRKGQILEYSYEVYRGEEKLYWYDPWPHLDDPAIANTFPHHKHVPPDIKHNRLPAPGLSFTEPNLPFLIDEIGKMLL
jgi:hypothetical protein